VVARMNDMVQSTSNTALQVGTRVEVRDRFCADWNSGFEIAAATPDSYRVRRLSDAWVLPVEFDVIDLRPVDAR
jgi:hypothetical protein